MVASLKQMRYSLSDSKGPHQILKSPIGIYFYVNLLRACARVSMYKVVIIAKGITQVSSIGVSMYLLKKVHMRSNPRLVGVSRGFDILGC